MNDKDGSFSYSDSDYNFLTTYYTDLTFDSYREKTQIEGLGVESVQISYESWYTNYINANSGIWVGSGIENQTLIGYNFSSEEFENNCGNSFGYVIDDGNPILVKLVGIEEEKKDG